MSFEPIANTRAKRAQTRKRLGQLAIEPGPLIAVLNAPTDDPQPLIRALNMSPALAARVLSIANSAATRRLHEISTVERAVLQLGTNTVRTVALAQSLRVLMRSMTLPPETLDTLWSSAILKANAAQVIAEVLRPDHAEVCYTIGLLQDLGLTMLMAVDPIFYAHEIEDRLDPSSWREQEYDRFGLSHIDVGTRLLDGYQVPEEIILAVRHHHDLPTDFEGEHLEAMLPVLTAGLMPHLNEPMTQAQSGWLAAVYERLLAPHFPSLEKMLQAIRRRANQMMTNTIPAAAAWPDLPNRVAETLTSDVMRVSVKLSQLEQQITQKRSSLLALREEALSDPLTKLLNRRGFARLAEKRLQAAAEGAYPVCCMLLDLDGFKLINDEHGHDAGDIMLRALAKLLRRSVSKRDIIARMGGDEFAILISDISSRDARKVANRLFHSCNGCRVAIKEGVGVELHMSVGVLSCNAVTQDVRLETLLSATDQLMYTRKKAGKRGVTFGEFDPAQHHPRDSSQRRAG